MGLNFVQRSPLPSSVRGVTHSDGCEQRCLPAVAYRRSVEVSTTTVICNAVDAALSLSAADRAADRFQRVHDARLVRTPAVQRDAARRRDCCELGLSLRGVLHGRAGKPMEERGLFDRPAQTIQEIITLLVFAAFSVLYLKEPMTWNYAIGFALVAAGGYFIFRGPL